MNKLPYKYAILGNTKNGTTIRLVEQEGRKPYYYRDNGIWGVEFTIENNKIISNGKTVSHSSHNYYGEYMEHLDGLEFFEISKERWAKQNSEYH